MSAVMSRCTVCLHIYRTGDGHDCPQVTYQAQQAANSSAARSSQQTYVGALRAMAQQAQAANDMQAQRAWQYGAATHGFQGLRLQGDHGPIEVVSSPNVSRHSKDEPRNCRDHCVPIEKHDELRRSLVDLAEHERRRAVGLSDECGRLKDENSELLRENAVLRRKVERLERKR